MREYLRVLVYPCALGLPPAYADVYEEVPIVMEAAAEIPTEACHSLVPLHSHAKTAVSATDVMLLGAQSGSPSLQPLGTHGMAILDAPPPPPSRQGDATPAPTAAQRAATASRLRAGFDRLRVTHRNASRDKHALEAQLVNTRDAGKHVTTTTTTSASTSTPDRQIEVNAGGTHLSGVASSADVANPRVADAQLHYITASLLTELEHHGLPLPARLAAGLHDAASLSPCATPTTASTHYTSSVAVHPDGVRECVVYPLEEGRYMATFLIPPTVWHLVGPSVVSLILTTALKGYEIGGPVAGSTAAPVYFPLDARLKENVHAVQAALQARLQEIADFALCVAEARRVFVRSSSGSLVTGGGGTSRSSRGAPGLDKQNVTTRVGLSTVVRRLVYGRPWSLQCGGERIRSVFDRLLREAVTRRTRTAMSAGVMAYEALQQADQRRFIAVGFGVWVDGALMYCSAPDASSTTTCGGGVSVWYESCLLPAALAITMAHVCRTSDGASADDKTGSPTNSIAAEVAASRPTERLFSTFSSHQDALLRSAGAAGGGGGFSDPAVPRAERALMAPSTLCLCLAARSGWTVVALLEPCEVPFTGDTLSGITMGMRALCTDHFASPAFQTLVRAHNPGMALSTAAAASALRDGGFNRLVSMLSQRREVATYSAASIEVLALVRKLTIAVRRTAHATSLGFSPAGLAGLHADVELFHWHHDRDAADAETEETAEEEHAPRLLRMDHHTNVFLSACATLAPFNGQSFAKRVAYGPGSHCRTHGLFAVSQTHAAWSSPSSSRGEVDDKLFIFHAFKSHGQSHCRRRRSRRHGQTASHVSAAATAAILYAAVELRYSEFTTALHGDPYALRGLTTWLLNKAFA